MPAIEDSRNVFVIFKPLKKITIFDQIYWPHLTYVALFPWSVFKSWEDELGTKYLHTYPASFDASCATPEFCDALRQAAEVPRRLEDETATR